MSNIRHLSALLLLQKTSVTLTDSVIFDEVVW